MENRRVFQINAIEDMFEGMERRDIPHRIFEQRPDFFAEYGDEAFGKTFRLSKRTCYIVLEKIANHIAPNFEWQNTVSAKMKLLIALRFYATGNFLITVGDFIGVSISSASRAVKEVSFAIGALFNSYIHFPNGTEQQHHTIAGFYKIARFPKVIGAIDCTHIGIQSPGGNNAEMFRNRKGFFSINVQAVCNAQLMFQDLVVRWPGSAPDSNIFRNSRLWFRLENGEFENCLILGDSGYKQCNYMMTPLLNPHTESESLYNESRIRTRNVIERCFGVWKRRFPILSFGMRVAMDTRMAIIAACGVLHNICIAERDPTPPDDDTLTIPDISLGIVETVAATNNQNCATRSLLIDSYFSRL